MKILEKYLFSFGHNLVNRYFIFTFTYTKYFLQCSLWMYVYARGAKQRENVHFTGKGMNNEVNLLLLLIPVLSVTGIITNTLCCTVEHNYYSFLGKMGDFKTLEFLRKLTDNIICKLCLYMVFSFFGISVVWRVSKWKFSKHVLYN